jgi:hypothetical protein
MLTVRIRSLHAFFIAVFRSLSPSLRLSVFLTLDVMEHNLWLSFSFTNQFPFDFISFHFVHPVSHYLINELSSLNEERPTVQIRLHMKTLRIHRRGTKEWNGSKEGTCAVNWIKQ